MDRRQTTTAGWFRTAALPLLELLAAGTCLAVAFVWPTAYVWRRHGVWPVVFQREAARWQRLAGPPRTS